MNKSPRYNQQSKSEVEKICVYHSYTQHGNTQWKVAFAASISGNKYLVGCMPERIPSNNI